MQRAPSWARDRALVPVLAMAREQVPDLERASEQEMAQAPVRVPEMERVMGKALA